MTLRNVNVAGDENKAKEAQQVTCYNEHRQERRGEESRAELFVAGFFESCQISF